MILELFYSVLSAVVVVSVLLTVVSQGWSRACVIQCCQQKLLFQCCWQWCHRDDPGLVLFSAVNRSCCFSDVDTGVTGMIWYLCYSVLSTVVVVSVLLTVITLHCVVWVLFTGVSLASCCFNAVDSGVTGTIRYLCYSVLSTEVVVSVLLTVVSQGWSGACVIQCCQQKLLFQCCWHWCHRDDPVLVLFSAVNSSCFIDVDSGVTGMIRYLCYSVLSTEVVSLMLTVVSQGWSGACVIQCCQQKLLFQCCWQW